jgi:hypothetical protein
LPIPESHGKLAGYRPLMKVLRRQLRSWTIAWLFFHVASYSALLPRDCCAAHAHRPKPLQTTQSDNATCAMHHEAPQPEPASETECSLRGTCRGPLAALNSLLSTHGVLPEALSLSRDAGGQLAARVTAESTLGQAVPPDPRPPRT